MELKVTDIVVPERMRTLNKSKVSELAQSIYEVGVLNPITVYQQNGHYVLCAGWHRLEAVRGLQRETILANVVDEQDAELIEIDENLIRNELTVLEQGEHLQRRNEILEVRGMRAKASPGTNQYSEVGETVSLTTEDIAEQVGLSKRSAQQRMQAARDIVQDVKDKIRDTEIADSTTQLLSLARMEPEEQRRAVEKVLNGNAKNVHVSNNSGENEWYTPPEYIEAARLVMGGIDLDPASSEVANQIVRAERYFTKEDNGLVQEWIGRVWMNPPYSQPEIVEFTSKMITSPVDAACVLVNNATETRWLQELLDWADAVCFVRGRIAYLDHTLEPKNRPLQGQAILYKGNNVMRFEQVFGSFGVVLHAAR